MANAAKATKKVTTTTAAPKATPKTKAKAKPKAKVATKANIEASKVAESPKLRPDEKDTMRGFTIRTFNALLKDRQKMGDTPFRKEVFKRVQKEFPNTSNASCASAYNTAKRLAVENGLTEDFGNSAKKAARIMAQAAEVQNDKQEEVAA